MNVSIQQIKMQSQNVIANFCIKSKGAKIEINDAHTVFSSKT